MDRRGFRASDDSDPYSIDRDFDDVAAVVDALAERSGAGVVVWGHSYGANCAMGGAALTRNVSHLVLYEPSLGLAYPPGAIEAVEEALASGDREAAIGRVLFDVLEMSEEEIEALRSSPRWENLITGAHTAPRECRAEQSWVYRRGQFDTIGAPTLLLSGSESPPAVRELTRRAADAIPNSRIEVLEGHGHLAHRTDPEMVVAIIERFVAE
jgi:pimeloyl-ACP methyl ester carboxylesterase